MSKKSEEFEVKFPGVPQAMDGTGAVVAMETAGGEAAGAYPITPSTQMGEGFAAAAADGKTNVFGRKLIFFEPEGEHAAAAVTAGMSLTGLRSTNFSSAQGIAYMHESLYAATGKRLTYVLNIAARAMTKQGLNIHCAHDDYHAVDDTGFFQLFAKNVQECADLNLIAHRIAELSLNPGIMAQDGFLTSHVIESLGLPEEELVRQFLGDPSDIIDTPTPAQRIIFGEKRRRIPELFDVDFPAMLGVVQNQDAYAQGVAAQRPFFFDHVQEFTDQVFDEFYTLTGRRYARATGYRTEDAEYVILGQGSIVWNLEEVCDHLRSVHNIKTGVINLTMFRPFPSDIIARILTGKKAVLVVERVDQPLASDLPILRETRGAATKALENARSGNGHLPYPGIPSLKVDEMPDFYSACYGLGSRDIQPGDLIAAVKNLLPGGLNRRFFYLGIDFVRKGTGIQKLEEHQQKVLAAYPDVETLALPPEPNVNLLPKGSLSARIHSVGGWGAITTGKNLAMTLFDLLGLYVKANPKYGSEKKGQPTTFYASFAHDPIRLNCDLRFVDVVLSPDPNVFRHSNPLSGLSEGGVFIIQDDQTPEELWRSLPKWAKEFIRKNKIGVFALDAFAIARSEASDPELQYRMQGAAFQGAFFAASPLMEREKLNKDQLFEAIEAQLQKKFGHRGKRVVDDNFRVITRGFDEVKKVDWQKMSDEVTELVEIAEKAQQEPLPESWPGIGDPHRFHQQVYELYEKGQDPVAEPFAALSAIPAATGTFRDMTGIRFEVPKFIAENCTGCGHCWTQCPDAAIPGLVLDIEEYLSSAVAFSGNGKPLKLIGELVGPLAVESRQLLKKHPKVSFPDILALAFEKVTDERGISGEQKAPLVREFNKVTDRLTRFPVARTQPFFDLLERKEEGSGGLLSVTINPFACKGCNLCVDVCSDKALVTVKQDEAVIAELRENWKFWERLPDTPDKFLQIRNLDEGIGVLHTLLLKKENYRAMVGGDGSCMGCGEKTGIHLIVSTIEAALQPHVAKFVGHIDELTRQLDSKARLLLASEVDLDSVPLQGDMDLHLASTNRERLKTLTDILKRLKDLKWRYDSGFTGKGRAALGMTNATGCSSVWGSTYPYNPYPFPWVNHLFQDAPSIAIGIFEGHMRKMADAFALVRRAELELQDAYKPEIHDKYFSAFDWKQFTEEELRLCPPILAVGGDGAMFDIGFQNLSRMMASGMPIRAVVLDTQVYSNTGGQACTSGFAGQISDMAAYGRAQHGKTEQRKELSLIALAHRTSLVVQTSQATPAHLIGGILKALGSKRPAVILVYTPCQTEHGIPDDASERSAKLALESRAIPFLVYDPDGGPTLSERLDLDGNPAPEDDWPTYELKHLDEEGKEQVLVLPLTIADWAATETRFGKHFSRVKPGTANGDQVPYHDYIKFSEEERKGKRPFIFTLEKDRKLGRLIPSNEIVELGRDRLQFWSDLREMAGIKVPSRVKEEISDQKEAEFELRMEQIRAEYETQIDQIKRTYPQDVARRMAEALIGRGGSLEGLISSVSAEARTPLPKIDSGAAMAPAGVPVGSVAVEEAPAPAKKVEEELEEITSGPWIDDETCTACDDCMKVNPKLFVYNTDKKATISDPKQGTYKDLVVAAERCPSGSIHPGLPQNPKERDLDKWVERAAPFNV